MNLYNLALEDIPAQMSVVHEKYAQALEMVSNHDSLEVIRFAEEYSRYTDVTKYAMECIDVAQAMHIALESASALSNQEARAIMTAVEGLRVSLGHTRGSKRSMSAESVNVNFKGDICLKMAKEGLVSFIADVIKAIIDAIVSIGKGIVNFIGRLFGRDNSSSSKVGSIEIKIEKVKTREREKKPLDDKLKQQLDKEMERVKNPTQKDPDPFKEWTARVSDEIAKDQARADATKNIKEPTGEYSDDNWKELGNSGVNKFKGPKIARSSPIPTEDELRKRAEPIVGALVKKVTQYGIKQHQVPHLSKGGVSYVDEDDLLNWLRDVEDRVVIPYEKFVDRSHLDKIIDNIADIFENIEDINKRGQCSIDLVEHSIAPITQYLKVSSSGGISTLSAMDIMGSYDMTFIVPDPKSGPHLVEKHLGSSSFEITKRDVQDKFTDVYIEYLDVRSAEKLLQIVRNMQASLAAEKIKDLEKMTSELERAAEHLKTKLKGDENEIQHLGKFAHKVVNFYTNVVFKYIFEVQKYSTRVINEVTLVASAAAEYEWAIYQASDELDQLIKQAS